VLGAGLGMLMQNLVLVVQNSIEVRNLGVATSAVTFFRSLGGTVGVSVLGSILGTIIASEITAGIRALAPADQAIAAQALGSGVIPQVSQLTPAVRTVVESAYGIGIGDVFLYSVPLAIVSLLAVIFLPNAQLGSKNAVQLKSDGAAEAEGRDDVGDALIGASAGAVALTPAGEANPTGSIRLPESEDAGADARR
jgi:hypothetical protein